MTVLAVPDIDPTMKDLTTGCYLKLSKINNGLNYILNYKLYNIALSPDLSNLFIEYNNICKTLNYERIK